MLSVSKKKPHRSHVRLKLLKSAKPVSNFRKSLKVVQRSLWHNGMIALNALLIRKKSSLSQKTRSLNIRKMSSIRLSTKLLILVQPIVAMQQKQKLPAMMTVVQTLFHANLKNLIQLVQRSALKPLTLVQQISVPSAQHAIAAMIHRLMPVMISSTQLRLTQMRQSISVPTIITSQQI